MAADTVLDIVVVGAGLSGINAGYRLQTMMPHRTFAILEARNQIGGTWSFWKYPGTRTDSAMDVFGFDWFPWRSVNNMAKADEIRQYINDAAASEGINAKINLGHRVVSANWRSEEQMWTLLVDVTNYGGITTRKVVKAWWLINATGYYRYDKALPPDIPGLDRFGGEVVHPQWWSEDVTHDGKDVIIIGSGATAVTLLPALAKTAKSVTMLQRSPTYVMALPGRVPRYFWQKFLPVSWSDALNWWLRMFIEFFFVQILSSFPNFARKFIQGEMRKILPENFDIEQHFNPRYNVFEQRLCFCPSGDFFKAFHKPNVKIVTDTIKTVTKTGIELTSGHILDANMIITATGLYVALLGGIEISVDDVRYDTTLNERYVWYSTMLDGLPNAGSLMGYVGTTWTPGADVRLRQLIKVMKHMEKTGATSMTPFLTGEERAKFPRTSALPLTSTYALSARERLPMAAFIGPWRSGGNWVADTWYYWFGDITKGAKYTFPRRKDN
ncbi:hypothetical protein OQA88_3494 [Cercophora sp. LCS_1]